MNSLTAPGTGFDDLDRMLTSLKPGDNVVWQVDDVDDYKVFVQPFVKRALGQSRHIIYMRFASHEPLVDLPGVDVRTLSASDGFESFSREIYDIITAAGRDAFYVFDCLSYLLPVWATDLMIGNLFVNTCPYLFELDTITYFAILRNGHNARAVARIRETTQVLLDLYHIDNTYYIHPIKVENRYSPTMFFPHLMNKDRFVPINNTDQATRFINYIQQRQITAGTRRQLDFWDLMFMRAEELVTSGTPVEKNTMIHRLSSLMTSKDERIIGLIRNNFTLDDFLQIKNRMIGTGYIGGKATGMLLARRILLDDTSFKWIDLLEYHDSYYIGSDVFYTYIVQNGLWRLFMEQRSQENYFKLAPDIAAGLRDGHFPEEITAQFRDMLDYFGTSPVIVRSSSLLEDGYGNAFAGKYESVFLANQGSPEIRLKNFTDAVRRVYASTMNPDALTYRRKRGLDRSEEQMALLVMRVSGSHHGNMFFPDMAGVGLSYNSYSWRRDINPDDGMIRIVIGLGTRAVDRADGDYPRIVALGNPMLQPLADMNDRRRFSQHGMDILNLETNVIETLDISPVLSGLDSPVTVLLARRDMDAESKLRELGREQRMLWLADFDTLLSDKNFTTYMIKILKTLELFYDYPVDIEFTVNFTSADNYRVNLLQCRPHQTRSTVAGVAIPQNIDPGKIFLRLSEGYLGGSTSRIISRVITINPGLYGSLILSDKYETARIIGRLNNISGKKDDGAGVMLIGPGRWGTTTPSLGVPVGFAEISNVSVLAEVALMSDNLIPELSFGSHFFLDLVETDIFYAAIFPDKKNTIYNESMSGIWTDSFSQLLPEYSRFAGIIRVFDLTANPLIFQHDIERHDVICYFP